MSASVRPLALLILVVFATPVMADLTAQVQLYDGHGSGAGGEFLLAYWDLGFVPVSLGEDPSGRFESFCVERYEEAVFDHKLYAEVNTEAVWGGPGYGPDPLDPKTAYLYEQFITGQLANYVYDVSLTTWYRRKSATALQNAIWYLEDELTDKYYGLSTLYERNKVDLFLADTNANAGGDIGNVRVLNLYEYSNRCVGKQDQLVLMPESEPIPAPGAAMLGVIGLGLVSRLRRRFA